MNAALTLTDSPRPALRHEHRDARRPPQLLSPRDFELFVKEYGERLHVVARRLLGCPADAADAVQDALLAAFTSLDRFQGESTVYTWLYRIVVNRCLMQLRSRRRVGVVSWEGGSPCAAEEGCHREIAAADASPAERLELEETRAAVRAAIARLPDCHREMLLLRDLEELDTQQTAELLELSYPAVKTRLHRARQALRALLESELGKVEASGRNRVGPTASKLVKSLR